MTMKDVLKTAFVFAVLCPLIAQAIAAEPPFPEPAPLYRNGPAPPLLSVSPDINRFVEGKYLWPLLLTPETQGSVTLCVSCVGMPGPLTREVKAEDGTITWVSCGKICNPSTDGKFCGMGMLAPPGSKLQTRCRTVWLGELCDCGCY